MAYIQATVDGSLTVYGSIDRDGHHSSKNASISMLYCKSGLDLDNNCGSLSVSIFGPLILRLRLNLPDFWIACVVGKSMIDMLLVDGCAVDVSVVDMTNGPVEHRTYTYRHQMSYRLINCLRVGTRAPE